MMRNTGVTNFGGGEREETKGEGVDDILSKRERKREREIERDRKGKRTGGKRQIEAT